MMKPVKYLSLLFLIPFVFSCGHTNPDFSSMSWTKAGDRNGIYFNISKKGSGEKAKLHLQYLGWLENNKFTQETATGKTAYLDSMINIAAADAESLQMLQKGSAGYVKFNLDEYFLDIASNSTHYMLFCPGSSGMADLRKDSLALSSMNAFTIIKITTAEQAADEFGKKYPDIKWQDFLDSNPLPSSISLTLKKDLYRAGKTDSIEVLLKKQFPQGDLSVMHHDQMWQLLPGTKKILIFNFTVL